MSMMIDSVALNAFVTLMRGAASAPAALSVDAEDIAAHLSSRKPSGSLRGIAEAVGQYHEDRGQYMAAAATVSRACAQYASKARNDPGDPSPPKRHRRG